MVRNKQVRSCFLGLFFMFRFVGEGSSFPLLAQKALQALLVVELSFVLDEGSARRLGDSLVAVGACRRLRRRADDGHSLVPPVAGFA